MEEELTRANLRRTVWSMHANYPDERTRGAGRISPKILERTRLQHEDKLRREAAYAAAEEAAVRSYEAKKEAKP